MNFKNFLCDFDPCNVWDFNLCNAWDFTLYNTTFS